MTIVSWFLLGLFLLGIELINFGLVSIWFAMGAFTTIFFVGFSLKIQILVFVLSSGIYLLLIRNIAIKHMKGKSKELDRVTGKKVVIESISTRGNIPIYTVRLDGKYWEGIGEKNFEVGESAVVKKIDGNKLVLIPSVEG